jgi:hypothetical protein
MTDEGLLTMAIAAQAMKGPRAGTALFSLYQQMVGGTMAQFKAKNLKDLGLVGDFAPGRGGNIQWAQGALDTPFANALKSDPMRAVQMLQDALVAHGKTTIDQQVPELFKLLGRQTTIRLVHDLLRNMPQIMGERGRISGGLGISASATLQNAQDYEQVMHNVSAAWTDMMAKVGLPLTVAAIPVMHRITDVFLKLGTLAIAHPDAISHLAEGITILGVALIGGGGVAILAALGPAGWLAAGVTAAGIACWPTRIRS